MAIETEMRRRTAVFIVMVEVFIALIVGIGATYNQSGLVSTGGLALVGTVTAFVLVMAGVGVWLSRSS